MNWMTVSQKKLDNLEKILCLLFQPIFEIWPRLKYELT